MDPVLSVALLGMQHDMARLDRVAMNLANAQTVGYKREVYAATLAQFSQPASAPAAPGVRLDQRPGTLRATGQKLDVALSGPGWFEVQTGHGIAYTRQGQFQLDPQGRLVTSQNHLVMGTEGPIQLPHGMPVIDAQGRIFEGFLPGAATARDDGMPIARLKVVSMDSTASVQRLGDGLLLLGGEPQPLAAGELQVRQGFLENANVNSMQEMVQLMQAMRHFESMQKVALGYDDMLASAIRRLGEVS